MCSEGIACGARTDVSAEPPNFVIVSDLGWVEEVVTGQGRRCLVFDVGSGRYPSFWASIVFSSVVLCLATTPRRWWLFLASGDESIPTIVSFSLFFAVSLKYRIIVASTCGRSVGFGCNVTSVLIANCVSVMKEMLHLCKLSCHCEQAWNTSHTTGRLSLIGWICTIFFDHVTPRLHWEFSPKFNFLINYH